MKLYYAPGACSFAAHVALIEADLPHTPVKVDLRTHQLADGTDYRTINPHGYVPLLEVDDGTRLSEVAVILQYIADRRPGTLAPAFGSMDRYQLMATLNFIATELHKGFSPLWKPTTPGEVRDLTIERLGTRFEVLDATLGKQPFVFGEKFTIADAYLYTILAWAKPLKIDLAKWTALTGYIERIAARPSVIEARRVESPKAA